MKKERAVLGFLLVSFFLIVGFTCPPDVPNSNLGMGAAQVCGVLYVCGNQTDGVCPEDFMNSTGQRANCSMCPDIDCMGKVQGYVKEQGTNNPISDANVSLHLSFVGRQNTTNPAGFYSLSDVPSGYQLFTASKTGYDTEVKEAIVTRRGITELNFSLPIGVCHPDCTNEFGRCNPICEGFNFTNTTDTCTYSTTQIRDACANKLAGTDVYLRNYNSTHSWYANCCEGTEYLKYNPVAQVTCKKSIIKYPTLVRYQNRPVNLVVTVCE